jgi:chemotaxis protein CheD
MNHFVLPCDPRGEQNSRYGIVAMAELLAGMMELGCRLPQLRAKVFGGAAVLPAGAGRTVGMSNVEVALETLRHAHIPVIAQRTGGLLGLHIKFHTASGEVFVRYLSDGIRNSQPGLPRT